jgi:hypothetical protein
MRFQSVLALFALASTSMVTAAPVAIVGREAAPDAKAEPAPKPGYGSYGDYGS